MGKVYLRYAGCVLLISFFFNSCKKPKEIPPLPVIVYKNFVKYGSDSAQFIFTFKDGDGDIGLNQRDTFPPFNSSSVYYYNLYMIYYYKATDGKFYPYDNVAGTSVMDTLQYTYRIPNITPKGQNKILFFGCY